jgi:hypothetical protein
VSNSSGDSDTDQASLNLASIGFEADVIPSTDLSTKLAASVTLFEKISVDVAGPDFGQYGHHRIYGKEDGHGTAHVNSYCAYPSDPGDAILYDATVTRGEGATEYFLETTSWSKSVGSDTVPGFTISKSPSPNYEEYLNQVSSGQLTYSYSWDDSWESLLWIPGTDPPEFIVSACHYEWGDCEGEKNLEHTYQDRWGEVRLECIYKYLVRWTWED